MTGRFRFNSSVKLVRCGRQARIRWSRKILIRRCTWFLTVAAAFVVIVLNVVVYAFIRFSLSLLAKTISDHS